MIDSERFKLLYGPYLPPKCQVGDKLLCESRGREVTVLGMSVGLIPWPTTQGNGRNSLILCGELIRAVRLESEIAVAHHWGVAQSTVGTWRRALEVPRMTLGSRRLRIEFATESLTPEVRAMARAAMHSTEVRAKLSAAKAGRPVHPNTIAALLEAAQRPKSDDWKRGQSERSRKMWQNPEAYGLPSHRKWSDEQIALLGTDSDRAIAQVLGLTTNVVKYQRERLGISRISRRWSDEALALLGRVPDSELARKLGKSASAIWRKREQLGIPPFAIRWTEEEIALIGTASDRAVGLRLGRCGSSVKLKREQLGIPPFLHAWTEEDLSWLGIDTDRAIAKALGRSVDAVRKQRKRLGIPAYRDV